MAASNAHDGTSYRYGLQGSITEVPAGYSLSYIIALAPSGGVNQAFESWGDKLLATYVWPAIPVFELVNTMQLTWRWPS